MSDYQLNLFENFYGLKILNEDNEIKLLFTGITKKRA